MEIWPKNDFSCFYYRFFTKNLSSPSFFRISNCKWARLKAYDIAQKRAGWFSNIRYQTRENGTQNGRCRPEMRFFAVAMATGYWSAVFAAMDLRRHVLHKCVKFHCNRFTRLASSVMTDRQTSRVASRISASRRDWRVWLPRCVWLRKMRHSEADELRLFGNDDFPRNFH